jgi:hypothetical protein
LIAIAVQFPKGVSPTLNSMAIVVSSTSILDDPTVRTIVEQIGMVFEQNMVCSENGNLPI